MALQEIMKCPRCNAWTFVLETRGERRKRECANKHRFYTVEIDASHMGYLEELKRLTWARKTLRRLGILK